MRIFILSYPGIPVLGECSWTIITSIKYRKNKNMNLHCGSDQGSIAAARGLLGAYPQRGGSACP